MYLTDEESKPSYIELENVFDELHCQFQKLIVKYASLKKKVIFISKEFELLENEQSDLKIENDLFK